MHAAGVFSTQAHNGPWGYNCKDGGASQVHRLRCGADDMDSITEPRPCCEPLCNKWLRWMGTSLIGLLMLVQTRSWCTCFFSRLQIHPGRQIHYLQSGDCPQFESTHQLLVTCCATYQALNLLQILRSRSRPWQPRSSSTWALRRSCWASWTQPLSAALSMSSWAWVR